MGDGEKREIFIELKENTFALFLAFIITGSGVAIWLANVQARVSSVQVVLLWLVLEAVCFLCWWLRRKVLEVAIIIFIASLWLCCAFAAQSFELPLCLYLFSMICLAADALSGHWGALIVSVASSLFIFSIEQVDPLPILMVWCTTITSFIAFRSLHEALDMAWSYQIYAIAQMSEAREHRGNLMQTTKALTEMQLDLERANTQLSHAHKAAEEARRLKAQFAANVSHELRTPINLIVGFSETIALSPQSYGVPLPPVYWADLNTIYRSAKHLQSLINDVLDVSQIEAGKMAIVKEKTLPQQVILEAGNLMRDLIESKGLTLKILVPDNIPIMYLDRTRIRQVILNLLSNAARFTDTGTIMLSAVMTKSELQISVKDSGIGIGHDDLDRVFEEFHQVEGTLSRKWGGSGLGLTLSKQFVEMHGGVIWAESTGIRGQGATFTFTLPFIDHNLSPLTTISTTFTESARYFVVLHNDPAILQLFERYTTRHRAVGVKDESEALRLVHTIRPAALVIDVEHPPLPDLHETPVIACAMPRGRRNLALPTDDEIIFVKPVTGETLHQALEGIELKNLLIVGEDRDIIQMLSRMIEAMEWHFQVWKAYSSEEGIALMRQQHLDAVIVDILTPDTEGLTLPGYIKADPMLAPMRVIVVSGSRDIDELTPASDGKMIITKTFQPVELVRCVEALIEVFSVGQQENVV